MGACFRNKLKENIGTVQFIQPTHERHILRVFFCVQRNSFSCFVVLGRGFFRANGTDPAANAELHPLRQTGWPPEFSTYGTPPLLARIPFYRLGALHGGEPMGLHCASASLRLGPGCPSGAGAFLKSSRMSPDAIVQVPLRPHRARSLGFDAPRDISLPEVGALNHCIH